MSTLLQNIPHMCLTGSQILLLEYCIDVLDWLPIRMLQNIPHMCQTGYQDILLENCLVLVYLLGNITVANKNVAGHLITCHNVGYQDYRWNTVWFWSTG